MGAASSMQKRAAVDDSSKTDRAQILKSVEDGRSDQQSKHDCA